MTSLTIRGKVYSVRDVDGSCFVIESEKIEKGVKLYSGFNLLGMDKKKLQKQKCFAATKGTFSAHGETEAQAIEDLHFKRIAERLKSQPLKPDTLLDKRHYRLITGACESMTDSWMRDHNMKPDTKIKAKDLLPLLEKSNAYGLQKFKSLLKSIK